MKMFGKRLRDDRVERTNNKTTRSNLRRAMKKRARRVKVSAL